MTTFDDWLTEGGPYAQLPTSAFAEVQDRLNGRMGLGGDGCEWLNEDRFLEDWPNLILAVILPDDDWTEEEAEHLQQATKQGFRFVFFTDDPLGEVDATPLRLGVPAGHGVGRVAEQED